MNIEDIRNMKRAEREALDAHREGSEAWDAVPVGAEVSFLIGSTKTHTLVRMVGRVTEVIEDRKGRLVFRSYMIESGGEEHHVHAPRVRVINATPEAGDAGFFEVEMVAGNAIPVIDGNDSDLPYFASFGTNVRWEVSRPGVGFRSVGYYNSAGWTPETIAEDVLSHVNAQRGRGQYADMFPVHVSCNGTLIAVVR